MGSTGMEGVTMKNKIIKRALLVGISLVIFLITTVGALAKPMQSYYISQYDINVNVLRDGSLVITEEVDFSFLGNSNNAVLLIDKQDDEQIEIEGVYTYSKDEWIEFEKLTEGEWGANVFNGTYSEIQESNLVRLKVYGVFKKQQAKIFVRYSVKNAIKRFNDIAVYNRNHVQKYWEGYISNLNIKINLPRAIKSKRVKSYLHGLLVGEKEVSDSGIIYYSIPNTVPGEYVETRVVFPEYLVGAATKVSDESYLETVLEEEKAYLESDRSNLLKVRENAAKEEGRRALNERQKQNFQIFSMATSLLASFLGIITIYRTNKAIKIGEKESTFTLEDIPTLSPAEARLLTQGKTGVRGIMGELFRLSSKGLVEVLVKGDGICFGATESLSPDLLKASEVKFLDLIGSLINEEGYFSLARINSIDKTSLELDKLTKTDKTSVKLDKLKDTDKTSDDLDTIKKLYNKWDKSIKKESSQKNWLTTEQLYYRNLGLIMGVILFAAGCILPVIASIWSGYLMIPVGFLLFNYALRIEKRTVYSTSRIRALNTLKELFEDAEHNIDKFPQWTSDINLALGFGIALEVDNRLSLLKELEKNKNDSTSNIFKSIDDESFETALRDSLEAAEVFFTKNIET